MIDLSHLDTFDSSVLTIIQAISVIHANCKKNITISIFKFPKLKNSDS